MKKDLEWGIKQIKEKRTEIANSSYEKDGGDCTTGVIIGLNKALNILSKLDRTEPEVDKLDKKIRGLESYNDKLIRDNNQLRNELDNKEVLSEDVPVIPDYVEERIEESKENKLELGEVFSSVFASLKLLTNPTKDLFWIRDNQELFAKAWLAYPNIEVEKEPQYRIRSGSSYLIYNLDGSVRPSSRSNATISKKRLEQLPFDVEKAIESGIIEVEEVK